MIRELVGDSRDLQVVVAAATRNLEQKSQAAATMEARRAMLVTDMAQLKSLRALYAVRSQRLAKASHARLASLKAATLTACGGALDDEAADDVSGAMALLLDGDAGGAGPNSKSGGGAALTFASPDALVARVREHEQLRWNDAIEAERSASDALVSRAFAPPLPAGAPACRRRSHRPRPLFLSVFLSLSLLFLSSFCLSLSLFSLSFSPLLSLSLLRARARALSFFSL